MSFPCVLLLGVNSSSRTEVWVVFPCCESRSHCHVLGLLFPLCFFGCGVQFCFEPLWVSNSWAEFLYFGTVHSCHGFYFEIGMLLLFPWFGMLWLSCFGHDRAKTSSELPCRLEWCLTLCLGLSPIVYDFFTEL